VSDDNAADTPDRPLAAAAAGAKPSGKRRAAAAGASSKPSGLAKPSSPGKSASTKKKPAKPNIFKRIAKFFREVISELRKVIWPNRKQMITYTTVVLVFVAFMVLFIGVLDFGVSEAVGWLFG
jgi:preprotein translocase subunit SecE